MEHRTTQAVLSRSSSTLAGRRRRDTQLEHRTAQAVLTRRRRLLRVGGGGKRTGASLSSGGAHSSSSTLAGRRHRTRVHSRCRRPLWVGSDFCRCPKWW
jgi:hypothetical protein